jgi:transposase InsO family protein
MHQTSSPDGVTTWRTTPYPPQQNGKMERFWRTLDNPRNGSCPEDTITHIISNMTPEAARRVGVNWRTADAMIDESISRNWTGPLNPNKSVLISSFRYYPLNIQIERQILKHVLYPFNFGKVVVELRSRCVR